MKKLFTEYWQEFDLRYIKNMYGAELPLLYFVIYWNWSLFLEMRQGLTRHLSRGK